MNDIKALIFDFDGTMVDSEAIWRQIFFPQFFKTLNHKFNINLQLSNGFPEEFRGKNIKGIVEHLNMSYNKQIDQKQFREEWFTGASKCLSDNNVQLKPGITDIINYADANKIPLAIVSSNMKEIIQDSLDNNNLSKYFRCIVSESDIDRLKPHPDPYLKVARILDIEPKNCLVFEDSIDGIMSAKKAGMKVFGVYDKANEKYTEMIRIKSDRYFLNLKGITKHLGIEKNIDMSF